jgi:hypothetical protein
MGENAQRQLMALRFLLEPMPPRSFLHTASGKDLHARSYFLPYVIFFVRHCLRNIPPPRRQRYSVE